MKYKEWWISSCVDSGEVSLCSTDDVCSGGGGGIGGCLLLCWHFRESLCLASSEVLGKYMVVL